ncbi:MAG TPA: cell wall-binding repeat-containing protein, partial [Candidatus Limnocylindrales bacterium]|nr:cell wall-binding repeat-containing protein [Candidatus Limnocylindrales bacterium]
MRNAALALALALLASIAVVAPGASVPVAEAAAPVNPKVVIIVGATHGATSNYRSIADQAYAEAIKYSTNVVKVYSPNATWDAVKSAIQGASVVIYLGHGNGFPSPYRTTPWPYSQNGFGLNAAAGQGDNNTQYYGEHYIANEVQLAPNAVVILNHLCYASGNSEPGYPLPTLGVAQQRVDNFAAGFLRAGARAVIAEAHGSINPYIRGLFKTHATVEEVWKNHSGYRGNDLRFGSARSPGYEVLMDPDGSTGGYYRAISGNLALRTEDVTGVPYVDTSLDPTSFVVPGAASVAVANSPIFWDQALTNQRTTLGLDSRVRVEEQVGGDGVTPLTLRVRTLDGQTTGWMAADRLVPRDSAGPEFWGLSGLAVLSPNGDGENDVLNLSGQLSELASWRFRILDGSNSVLVETTGTGNVATISWDGMVNGSVAQDGRYAWQIRAEDGWGNTVLLTTGSFFVDRKPEVRYAGSDRYATAAAISAAHYAPGVAVAYVATGANFPDALAGAAVAGNLGGPLLLVT